MADGHRLGAGPIDPATAPGLQRPETRPDANFARLFPYERFHSKSQIQVIRRFDAEDRGTGPKMADLLSKVSSMYTLARTAAARAATRASDRIIAYLECLGARSALFPTGSSGRLC